ncbi:MAG: hypothetical protein ACYC6X_01640 [Minisyncoccota bacterium]
MNQNQPELTFDESVAQVMQTLPPPIREYLAQGRYSIVTKNLMFKYQLRIDQGGVLEREIMLLIMGVENPTEFTQALVEEAKLDQKAVDGIVRDVNDQIFIPLQKEIRSAGSETQEKKFAAPSAAPRHLINKIQKPILGEKLLEDHEEPHIEFNKAPVPLTPRAVPTPSLPRLVIPVSPPPPPPSKIVPPVPPPSTPPSPRPAPPARPYASDPYREPLDEKE